MLTVVTHSSGNHAQALALAARELGVRAHIVMPNTASSVKKAAVRGYGATVTECVPTLQAREDTAKSVIETELNADPGRVVEFIPPYDDGERLRRYLRDLTRFNSFFVQPALLLGREQYSKN